MGFFDSLPSLFGSPGQVKNSYLKARDFSRDIPVLGGVDNALFSGLDKQAGYKTPEQQQLEKSNADRAAAAKDIMAGGYNQQQMENIYAPQAQGVEQGYGQASNAAASGYARRGLGHSGLAQGAQQQAATSRDAQLRLARSSAINQATEDLARQKMQSYGVAEKGWSQDYQTYMDALNAQRSQDAQTQQLLMGGLGTALGMAMPGAGAGGITAAQLQQILRGQGGGNANLYQGGIQPGEPGFDYDVGSINSPKMVY